MFTLTLDEAKKKLDSFKLKEDAKKTLEDVLNRKKNLPIAEMPKDVVEFIENRLSQEHLRYLEQNEVDGVWGPKTTNAVTEMCQNYHIRFDGLSFGQSALLCLLDGTKPSEKRAQSVYGKNLTVKYYSQRDSEIPGQAYRMCFSSCCAMKLHYANPALLSGQNGDDQYLQRVNKFGDSTDPFAQIQALRSYGLKAAYNENLTFQDILDAIKQNKPVVALIWHKGAVNKLDRSGGHAILIKGVTLDGKGLYVNDPFGELDLVSGQYVSDDGANKVYSVTNFMKRWADGGPHGWGII